VYYNLKNKSQKFIKSAVSLREIEINSIVLMNNQLKEASNVIFKYGENNDFDSKHFLTETLFYIYDRIQIRSCKKGCKFFGFFWRCKTGYLH
jgi:hypothetical protein